MDPGKRQDPERHSEGPPMSVRQATDLVPPEKKTTKSLEPDHGEV